MYDFQWVVSAFLLQHLRTELIVTVIVLAVVLALTAVFVGVELRRDGEDDHADQ